MTLGDDVQLWHGRLITAGRGLAGLSIERLAAEAGVGVNTIRRIEDKAVVRVTPGHRHGAVSCETWDKIVEALERHGVELVVARGGHGAGVRLTRLGD